MNYLGSKLTHSLEYLFIVVLGYASRYGLWWSWPLAEHDCGLQRGPVA